MVAAVDLGSTFNKSVGSSPTKGNKNAFSLRDGVRVIIGSIFLVFFLYRQINYQFTRRQHIGLECAI
jgi:hypothetical protein